MDKKRKRVSKSLNLKNKVVEIYVDPNYGLTFITNNKKVFAYIYYRDVSGAICDIDLKEV